MEASNWFVLKIICGSIAALLAFLATLFTFFEYAQNEKHEKTRIWFRTKWIAIKNSKWLSLPEKMIAWVLHLIKIEMNSMTLFKFAGVGTMIISFTWISLGFSFFTFTILCLILLLPFLLKILNEPEIGLVHIYKLLPFYLLGAITIFLSTIISLSALGLGMIFDQSAPRGPGTLQILIPNIFFDSLTIIFTFVLLSWAIKKHFMFRIVVAIAADIILAVLFACASLYFCLLFTELEISFIQTFNVLRAKNATGVKYELGPYFWLMHTTFIPTILYLALILIAWLAKLILLPVGWFFGKGREHKNPLKLTAALCGVIAAFFTILFFVANTAENIEKNKTKTTSWQKSSYNSG